MRSLMIRHGGSRRPCLASHLSSWSERVDVVSWHTWVDVGVHTWVDVVVHTWGAYMGAWTLWSIHINTYAHVRPPKRVLCDE
jgi:hypothetical protein